MRKDSEYVVLDFEDEFLHKKVTLGFLSYITKSVYSGRIERRKETNSTRDALFTMEEMKRAIARAE